MIECKHGRLTIFHAADDGEPVGLWACAFCGHKFVPLDLALEKDAERYRYLKGRVPSDVLQRSGPDAGCWIDCEVSSGPGSLTLLTGDDADTAIDAAMLL
jgi:hypothetical protein